MFEYTIVPLGECETHPYRIQGKDMEQWAFTDLDTKPDGDGWQETPNVRTDENGIAIGLIWRRAYSIAAAEQAHRFQQDNVRNGW